MCRQNFNKALNGFTLIELLVTISLALIVLSYGVPSFSSFIQNGRLTTLTNNLVTDINYARSEAVTRGKTIVICRSADASMEHPTCSGLNNNWTSGWLVFVSEDTNNTYDEGVDTLLRATSRSPGSVDIISNDTSDANLIYKGDGATNMAGETAVFAVCDARGESHGNQLQISPTGRPRLIAPIPEASACNSPSA